MQASGRPEVPNKKDFDRLLLESIDSGLADLLGIEVREVAYKSLAKHLALARNEIPGRTGDFGTCLVQLFGVGGKTIGRVIAKRLYSRLGLNFLEKQGYQFHDYIEEARARDP